jgi:cellulose synthase/poly-beta-1,6-N-acetylglucosamine synthase-like glycosyltransferase
MIGVIEYLIFGIYIAALVYILIFCLIQFHLLYIYRKKNSATPLFMKKDHAEQYPFVTVQLPIFNELYVVERLIDCVAQFNYPKSRFEIHILDDSTDETVAIVKRKVEEYVAKGFQIRQIQRENRTGFKAGALKEGMKHAKGEFIAIFDADFLPNPDFLKRTLPYFASSEVGVVQTRWEHINEDYSLITKLQAFQLNVHFTIEQSARQLADYFLQFNGTGGVWRRKAIEDAGGWEADTLTEDLDLSIRAQMNGWKITYLEEFGSPAELPAEMNGLKSQQFRWMKGGAETAKKMIPKVWRSGIPLWKKFHATIHLLSSTIFVFVFIVGVLSVPALFLIEPLGFNKNYFAIFLTGLLTIGAVYFVGNSRVAWQSESIGKRILKFIFLFPIFLSLSMGLSLHNTVAVIQGYIGRKSPFVRTPKFNIQGITDSLRKKKYLAHKIPITTVFEGILALYFLAAIIAGIYCKDTAFILFHFLLMVGYGSICFFSIRHVRLK